MLGRREEGACVGISDDEGSRRGTGQDCIRADAVRGRLALLAIATTHMTENKNHCNETCTNPRTFSKHIPRLWSKSLRIRVDTLANKGRQTRSQRRCSI
jgi:hypothetical protein